MELDSATMAGEPKKAACDWVPPTPLKSGQERRGNDSAAGGGGAGAGAGAGVVARKVSFAVPENPSSSNIGNFGINRKPECIIIDKPDNKSPHQESNAGCEFGANPMKASNEAEIVTPEKKKERKKRVKVKKHRPRVLDKFKTKKKPSTPKPTKPSTPKPRTPKRPKLADKNTISNNSPVLLPKTPHLEELADSNENICRRKLAFDVESHSTADQSQKASVEIESKLDFDIENQSTTDQSQKASVEIESKPEVGAKLHKPVRSRCSSLIVYRRKFRLNECLKNSRKLGPNCPGVFKKARTRRPRATTFGKFFRLGSLPPTTQTKNNSVMNELMGLGPIVSNRLTRSQTREAVKHPDFEKCRTNSQWKGKRKRSKMLARIRYLSSFVKDISKLQFSETFILKASAIRIKDVSSEIPVAHVEAQNEGVLNLDKSELIENQKLMQDNVVSGNEGIHDSEDRKSIEQQELHPNNVDYCHESSQICLEDFEDPMVGVEMSVDACGRIPTFVGPSENKDGEVVVVVEDDLLASHNYDWFTKGVVDYITQKMEDIRIYESQEKPKKQKPKMDLDMDLVMLNGQNKDSEEEKPKKHKPKMDLDMDLVMLNGQNKDAEEEKPKKHKPKVDLDMDLVILNGQNKDAEEEKPKKHKPKMDLDMDLVILNGQNKDAEEEKPKKHKPKMDLDMDLVMLNGQNKDAEEEYWARERRLFEGRIDEFIAILNILQGKKPFSPWKGSVLDSVIGVLLTQNVNDKFSSCAFMNVSSRFSVVSDHRGSDRKSDSRLKINEVHSNEYEQFFSMEPCENSPTQPPTQPESISSYPQNSPTQPESISSDPKPESISSDPTSCQNSPVEVQTESISSYPTSCQNSSPIEVQTESTPKSSEAKTGKGKKKVKKQNLENMNWDELRLKYTSDKSKNRSEFTADSVNWEAVRETPVEELADVIKDRGMNNILAKTIKNFLNRILRDHGALDLEWLRDVPPEKAKEYLLSFDGLGLKSVECVRLLELHCTAFPVDVNIARIATRLNWVNLHALPEGVQIHDLNDYPSLDSVQKFLAPRVSHIPHAKLYQFHCHLILFGKSLCGKRNPNCGPCPLKTRCKHYASKHGRPLLEGYASGNKPSASSQESQGTVVQWIMDPNSNFRPDPNSSRNSNPIIETPESPVRERSEPDLEDFFKNKDDEYEYDEQDKMLILNLSRIGRDEDMQIGREEGMSKALARIIDSSHPVIKLKELQRLRTIHQVYELPDSHPLLAGFDKRNEADLCPYLLAIWISGMPGEETTKKIQNNSEEGANLGNILKYQDLGIIQGTILIPCRTANRGSFPLNGTYFQPNQVFADNESSLQPILIPKESVCNLKRRVLYCSKSLHSICNGMKSAYELACFFNIGFLCVNGFDRKKRKPTQLHNQFHPHEKEKKEKKEKL